MKKRGAWGLHAALAAVLIAGGLLLRQSQTPGAARTDAFLREYAISEEGGSITLKMDVASSAGYLSGADRREEGSALYLTFHGTRGLNNPSGAKDSFHLPLAENCDKIYIWGQGETYHLALQKDDAGLWREPA